jgi:peptidoglycan/xylan/chitin deacetylase (PgdA/CDA1 family)
MKKEVAWPNGAQAAAAVTVDLDGEFVWTSLGELVKYNYDTPKNRSMGTYGTLRGLGRILESFDRHSIKGTFFVPGAFADMYPGHLRGIADRGHEIGIHGYTHRDFALLSEDEQRGEILSSVRVVEDATGVRPVGFRLPEGNCTSGTLRAVAECGMLYDSSFFDHDFPYVMPFDGSPDLLVEIPVRWELQDFPYFAHGPRFPMGGGRIAIYDDVLENWLYELDACCDAGYCYVIKFDPQIIGTPGRMFMLDTALERIARKNIWVAKCGEIAARFADCAGNDAHQWESEEI